ncbi:MAG: serine/threonine protein kinase [Myxococcales bacterium]|nr:serine/threonine protein kinase [Myxococcales bacterium]
MGVVYAAQHALIGRHAAVKVLLPELSQNQDIVTRFFNEARAATAIRHPGIVEIFDFGYCADGSAYIVMELLAGESLAARMLRGRMSVEGALLVVRQIAGALAAAHAQRIVHRDLKPDNVFLVPDPEVPGGERIKLLDFGIAKLTGDGEQSSKTRTGTVMGTPTYMAPEQCRGVSLDHRADLYSLGCILFELLTGRPPFVGEGVGDVLAAHIHVPPPPLLSLVPDAGPELDQLMQRLLAKDPEYRIQTAAEIIHAVDALSGGAAYRTGPAVVGGGHLPTSPMISGPTTLSGSARLMTSAGGPPLARSRTPLFIGAGVLAVAAIAVLAIVAGGGSGAKSTPPAAAEAAPVAAPPPVEPTPVAAPAPTPVAPTPVAPPAPAPIELVVDSKPAGATVLLDGVELGTTPYHGTRPPADGQLALTVRLKGHVDATVTAPADASSTQRVDLKKRPRAGTHTDRDDSVNPFGP